MPFSGRESTHRGSRRQSASHMMDVSSCVGRRDGPATGSGMTLATRKPAALKASPVAAVWAAPNDAVLAMTGFSRSHARGPRYRFQTELSRPPPTSDGAIVRPCTRKAASCVVVFSTTPKAYFGLFSSRKVVVLPPNEALASYDVLGVLQGVALRLIAHEDATILRNATVDAVSLPHLDPRTLGPGPSPRLLPHCMWCPGPRR